MDDDAAYDVIGTWSEIKLEIIRAYAHEYTKILKSQGFRIAYVDAFSGRGLHITKDTGQFVLGSPMNALYVDPPFDEFFFIDMDRAKLRELRRLAGEHPNIHYEEGDCNQILLDRVFPNVRYKDFRRALCLLDPYKLNLDWQVVLQAGQERSIELFINFPVMDMNRNVLRHDLAKARNDDVERMNKFWGDDSWRQLYQKKKGIFGQDYVEKAADNQRVVRAYVKRLKDVAGFKWVPEPLPMKNSINKTVYYLVFASPNATANKIVSHIFKKRRQPE